MSINVDTEDPTVMEIDSFYPPKEVNGAINKNEEIEVNDLSSEIKTPVKNEQHALSAQYDFGVEKINVTKTRNGILLVLVISIKAQKILKEGLKQTKLDNTALEKRCKELSGRVSIVFEEAKNDQGKWNIRAIEATVASVGMSLAANWVGTQTGGWWQETVRGCTDTADYFSAIPILRNLVDAIPGMLQGIAERPDGDRPKFLSGLAAEGGNGLTQFVQGFGRQVDVKMNEEKTPKEAAYSATNSLYQARVQDISSEQQGVDGAKRTTQEVMQQEEKLFEGAMGKG